jgi:hypothetical protein
MKSPAFHTGRWWRFERYIIKDGYIIRAPGAKLIEYDVWEQFMNCKTQTRKQPPYQELLSLLHRLGAVTNASDSSVASAHFKGDTLRGFSSKEVSLLTNFKPRSGLALAPLRIDDLHYEPELNVLRRLRRLSPLPPDANDLIVQWCNKYGLLGILPHMCESVVFSPRWKKIMVGSKKSTTELISAEAEGWYRTNGQWWDFQQTCEYGGKRAPQKQDIGRLAHRAYLPRSLLIPFARIRHLDYMGLDLPFLREETLLDTRCNFFPSIAKRERLNFQYPCPLTEEFWTIYSESIEDFLRYAVFFLEALLPHPSDFLLESLIEPIGIALNSSEPDQLSQSWRCPSLLSMFALMALQDLAGESVIKKCNCCGYPFVSSAYQSLYCSETCGWRGRKRRARALADVGKTAHLL